VEGTPTPSHSTAPHPTIPGTMPSNIVILGAGTVGTSIAETLCAHAHNVTVVDADRRVLDTFEERVDVRTTCGSACDAIALFGAGVQSSLLCLAVTSRDEVNLVGASLAKAMGARRCVARVQNPAMRDTSTFDYQRHFGVDRLLSIEHLTALELAKSIRSQGLFAVEHLARGAIEVQDVEVQPASRAVGVSLKDLDLPKNVRVGMITSQSRTIVAGANDVIHAGNRVTLIGSQDALRDVQQLFEHRKPPRINVIVAGGGQVGYNLARILEHGRFNVVLMESDSDRCRELAARLDGVTVLHGDATRRSELEEARVGKSDVFVAAMGRDEDNIICGVEARELGAKRVLGIVRRPDYANVLGRLGIDVAVSPRQVMAREVLGMVEPGPITGRSTVADTGAEIWEVEILKDAPITRAPLRDVQLRGGLIAAFEREGYVRVPAADDQLAPGDTAVVLVHGKAHAHVLSLLDPSSTGG
jgi:trk system potassium uptake protein